MIEMKSKDFMDFNYSVYYQFLGESTLLEKSHSHDFWELFFVIKGAVNHHRNQVVDTLGENNLVIISPEDTHTLKTEKDDCRFLNFVISDDLLHKICNFIEFNINDFKKRKTPVQITDVESFNGILEKIKSLNTMEEYSYNQGITLRLITVEIIFFIVKSMNITEEERNIPSWFSSLMGEMNQPQNIELGIAEVAQKKGYGLKALNACLKKHYDTTSSKYTTFLRLNYAANLLASTDMDILSISLEVGYSSLSHFLKLFKDRYDMTPSQYRKARRRF